METRLKHRIKETAAGIGLALFIGTFYIGSFGVVLESFSR
jgi:hypothetical protein